MNITFFIANDVRNIFSLSDIFEKISIFRENCENQFSTTITIFEINGASDDENEYNLFGGEYDSEYFFIKLSSQIKGIFCEKIGFLWEWGWRYGHFLSKGRL